MNLVLPMAPGEEVSAAAALSLLQFFALEHQADFDVRWLKGSLTERIFTRWVERLEGCGAKILRGKRVNGVVMDDSATTVNRVTCADGSEYEADAVVMAVGISGAKAIVRSCPALAAKVCRARHHHAPHHPPTTRAPCLVVMWGGHGGGGGGHGGGGGGGGVGGGGGSIGADADATSASACVCPRVRCSPSWPLSSFSAASTSSLSASGSAARSPCRTCPMLWVAACPAGSRTWAGRFTISMSCMRASRTRRAPSSNAVRAITLPPPTNYHQPYPTLSIPSHPSN